MIMQGFLFFVRQQNDVPMKPKKGQRVRGDILIYRLKIQQILAAFEPMI
jgi:hypothetical protein